MALVLISASVALRVEDARGVSADDQAEILAAISQAVEAHSGRAAAVDRAPCKKKDRCLAEVAQRVQAEDVVFLRMLGVPTRVRIIAERQSAAPVLGAPSRPAEKKTGEIDLPRAREGWGPPLAALAGALFEAKVLPQVVEETPPLDAQPQVIAVAPPQPVEPPSVLREYAPWIAIGAGGLAAAAGVGFGLSARSARSSARDEPHTDREFEELEDRAFGHGLAANVLFGAAVIGAGTGVVLLLLED